MNLKDARNEILMSAAAGNAVLLRSGSGIGKSDLVRQVFQYLKDSQPNVNWGFGTIFAATQTPPDLIGFQFKGEREFEQPDGTKRMITVTDPSVPLWFISHEGKPAYMYDKFGLFIDEYGQGEADVKRSVAEIFLNGGTSPWYLPPGSMRIAATNKGSRYGVTKDFDFCVARRTEIEIDGDVDVWVEHADKPYVYQGREWQVQPVLKAWALSNPTILFEGEPKEQGPWCNPRTLCSVGRYITTREEFTGKPVNPDDPAFAAVVAGTIGTPAMVSLVGTMQFAMQLPSYEAVVADPKGTPVPGKADLVMLMAYELAGRAKPEHLAEIITYIQRLPKDMAVTFISSLLRRDYKNLINQPAMQGWLSKNASLVSVIASLSQ